jgi:nicotinamidase-related amidase
VDIVNPGVVVIDMHRGSCEAPGTVFVPRSSIIIKPLQRFLRDARALSFPVIFVNYQGRTGGSDARNPFWMGGEIGKLYPNVGEQTEGSRWAEVMPDLEPMETDLFVNTKRRYSAFYGTDLELLLRNLRVETVILTGVLTEICVLCSAFEAFNRDYGVVVLRDCTAGRDPEIEACVLDRIIALEVGWVMTSGEVISSLGQVIEKKRGG